MMLAFDENGYTLPFTEHGFASLLQGRPRGIMDNPSPENTILYGRVHLVEYEGCWGIVVCDADGLRQQWFPDEATAKMAWMMEYTP